LFAKTAQHADDLCIIRSRCLDLPNHEPSLGLLNCGEARLDRPSLGSWITYGLGSMNRNLPGYIAMCPGGMPIRRTKNWQAGFLPSAFRGADVDTPITRAWTELVEFIRNGSLDSKRQREQLDLLLAFNQRHLAERQKDTQLEARITKLRTRLSHADWSASDAFDIMKEPEGRSSNVWREARSGGFLRPSVPHRASIAGARRALPPTLDRRRTAMGQSRRRARSQAARGQGRTIQPIAALLTDLKQRGLFDETLVVMGGEFGRTPVVELPTPGLNAGKQRGRGHQPLRLRPLGSPEAA